MGAVRSHHVNGRVTAAVATGENHLLAVGGCHRPVPKPWAPGQLLHVGAVRVHHEDLRCVWGGTRAGGKEKLVIQRWRPTGAGSVAARCKADDPAVTPEQGEPSRCFHPGPPRAVIATH